MRESAWAAAVLASMMLSLQVNAADRIWSNQGPDNGTVHSLGNGTMLVYETGPNITTLYPGPFSTPSLYTFRLEDQRRLEVGSTRERGTAIWTHEVSREGNSCGTHA